MDAFTECREKMMKLARNLWWTWHPEAINVWRGIDRGLWRESRHSPIAFMKLLGEGRLKALCKDPGFLIKLNRVVSDLKRYMEAPYTWGGLKAGPRKALGLSHEEFMELGRVHPENHEEPFCMTVLALKTAGKSNAVSSIHAKVSRLMWAGLWPQRSFRDQERGHHQKRRVHLQHSSGWN